MTSSKYFYLEHILIMIIHARYCYSGGAIDSDKPLKLIATLHYNSIQFQIVFQALPYHTLSCRSCLLCKLRCSLAILSMHTCLLIRDY